MNARDERTWATLTHLGGLFGIWFFSPVGNVLVPLVLWLIKRNESAFVDDQGREAVNFQITMSILSLVLGVAGWMIFSVFNLLDSVVFWHSNFTFFPHVFFFQNGGLSIVAAILSMVFAIIAATRANNGIAYRYPLSLRLVK